MSNNKRLHLIGIRIYPTIIDMSLLADYLNHPGTQQYRLRMQLDKLRENETHTLITGGDSVEGFRG